MVTDAGGVTELKAAYERRGISSGGDLRASFASAKPGLEQLAYLGFMKTAQDKANYAVGSEEAFASRYINKW